MTVAYQGEPGAYSEAAAYAHFGPDARARGHATFGAAVGAVRSGEADAAVIPVRNSGTGAVASGVAAVREGLAGGLLAGGEVVLPIAHALMAAPGVPPAAVRRVRSHPEALRQCALWLARHLPRAAPQPGPARAPDTAGAAREIARGHADAPGLWRDAAAIAHPAAAQRYGLAVLARGVADDPDNATTFAVLVRPVAGS